MIYFKSINHEKKELGYCYLQDVRHAQYPKRANLLNPHSKDLLYTEEDQRDRAYIEIHNTAYKENKFRELATSTAESRYCVLTQMVANEAHIITHIVKVTSDKVYASARTDEESRFYLAIKGEVVAYLDPIKLRCQKRMTYGYTEYMHNQSAPKGISALNYFSSYDPDFGAVQKVLKFPFERLSQDIAKHAMYTVISAF